MTPQTAFIILSIFIFAAFLGSLIYLIIYLRKHKKQMKKAEFNHKLKKFRELEQYNFNKPF